LKQKKALPDCSAVLFIVRLFLSVIFDIPGFAGRIAFLIPQRTGDHQIGTVAVAGDGHIVYAALA